MRVRGWYLPGCSCIEASRTEGEASAAGREKRVGDAGPSSAPGPGRALGFLRDHGARLSRSAPSAGQFRAAAFGPVAQADSPFMCPLARRSNTLLPQPGRHRTARGGARRVVAADHRDAGKGSVWRAIGRQLQVGRHVLALGVRRRHQQTPATRAGVREWAAHAATSWQPGCAATSTGCASSRSTRRPRHPVAATQPVPVVLFHAAGGRAAAPAAASASAQGPEFLCQPGRSTARDGS